MYVDKIDPIEFIVNNYPHASRILYMPNAGNLGDSLIAAATIQAFGRAGVKWEFMRGGKENVKNTDIVVYGGGGSLIEMYPGAYDCLTFLHSLGVPVIVFPQTVRGRKAFWMELPGTTVFCRDLSSYEFVSSLGTHEVYLADDMAVRLNMDMSPYKAVKAYREAVVRQRKICRHTIRAFRKDLEGNRDNSVQSEIDFSEFAYPSMTTAADIVAHSTFFLTMIAGYKKVFTDRLHVAIACGLLAVECECYDNSYGKLRAVYEITLKGRFDSVSMV